MADLIIKGGIVLTMDGAVIDNASVVVDKGLIKYVGKDTKLKSREKFVKKWNGAADGRITTMYAPHSAASCSKEFLVKVKELAARDNSRVHIHVLETEDELKTMKERYGMCSVNLLNSIGMLGPSVLAAHCIWLSDDDIDILKQKEVNVVHCPSSNMALGAGVAPVPEMLGKGIIVTRITSGNN
ncbi:MAG: amidohydrolase family protein [Candidatus Methanoperedens sp.]|nr:amidohydrolase family protein [Candidatus Methanoperedens sp.]